MRLHCVCATEIRQIKQKWIQSSDGKNRENQNFGPAWDKERRSGSRGKDERVRQHKRPATPIARSLQLFRTGGVHLFFFACHSPPIGSFPFFRTLSHFCFRPPLSLYLHYCFTITLSLCSSFPHSVHDFCSAPHACQMWRGVLKSAIVATLSSIRSRELSFKGVHFFLK